jgi:serine protease AprX
MNGFDKKIDSALLQTFRSGNRNVMLSVIIFADEAMKEETKRELQKCGGTLKYDLGILGALSAAMPASQLAEFSQRDCVVYISSDAVATTCMDLARKIVGAEQESYTGEGIGVAVLDTGCYPHTDLTMPANRIEKFVDFVGGKKRPYDDNGHGTHCCGIIAGNGFASNGKFAGIAPKASLIVLKVMGKNGEGKTSDILAGLDWIWKNRAIYNIRVVSISLGAIVRDNTIYDPLMLACEKLWNSGLIVVAAAGNEGPSPATIGSPGVSKKVITVGCLDDHRTIQREDDTIAPFSSRGPSHYTKYKPDLVAPGVDIMSLSNENNGYVPMTGSSMSTPIVSGACALLLEKSPQLSQDEVKSILIRNAHSLKLSRNEQGSGMVDLTGLL